jgi:hypothetical protein
MAANTNSAAFNQLKPLFNNNLGAIVSEHIRYYQNRKDDKDAQQSALDAQAAKLRIEKGKRFKEAYEGLSIDDNESWAQSQIAEAFEAKGDLITELSNRVSEGDRDAIIQYGDLKRKFKSLSNTSKVWGAKAQEYANDEANFNIDLDQGIKNTTEAIGKGFYTLDKETLNFDLYNPETGEKQRTLKGGEISTDPYLTGSYSGKSNFKGNGLIIANQVLDDMAGKKIKRKDTRRRGTELVKAVFGSDNIEARSFLARTRRLNIEDGEGKIIKFNDKNGNPIALNNLSDPERTKLASLYYEKFVDPQIIEKTPKPSNTGSDKTNGKSPTINIVGDTQNGEVRLVADPSLKPTDTGYTGKGDTEVYIIDKTVRKEGNTNITYDKVYYNRNTGQLSVDVSKYQTITTPSGEIVRVDASNGIGLVSQEEAKEKSRKGVATNNVFNDEDITELAVALGLQDQDDIIKLLDNSKTSFLNKQEAKNKENNNATNKGNVR